MKSAKEMFKEIGYRIDIRTIGKSFGYMKKINDHERYITFNDSGNCKWFTIIETDRNNPTIDLEELQAINKQVEELGWNDTTVNIDVKLDGKKICEAMRGVNNA